MKEIATLPLFAIPVSVYYLEDINQEEVNKILTKLEYSKINKTNNHSSISKTLNLLNEYKELEILKSSIDKSIVDFSENKIGNAECKFQLTNSWGTKTETGQSAETHKHSNNIFSAVYYNENTESTTGIRFYNFFNFSSFEISPSKYTIFNSTYWDITPKEKNLIIFPAYLRHSVLENKSNKTRYSIACNYHPIEKYGQGDSAVINLGFKPIG